MTATARHRPALSRRDSAGAAPTSQVVHIGELDLAALAACAGLYVLICCRARGIPTDRVSLHEELVFEHDKEPRIRLIVLLPPDCPNCDVSAVRAAVDASRITRATEAISDLEVMALRGTS